MFVILDEICFHRQQRVRDDRNILYTVKTITRQSSTYHVPYHCCI